METHWEHNDTHVYTNISDANHQASEVTENGAEAKHER